jgi:hypothetical protein
MWIMLGIGALMLGTAVLPSGAWGATMDDVKKEMAETARPFWGERPVMYVPMVGSGNTLVAMTSLCVSGGRLRPIAGGATVTDLGPAPQDNQYSIQIFSRDGGGYDIYQYERKVTLPNCK